MLRNLFAMNSSYRNQSGGQLDSLYAEVHVAKSLDEHKRFNILGLEAIIGKRW